MRKKLIDRGTSPFLAFRLVLINCLIVLILASCVSQPAAVKTLPVAVPSSSGATNTPTATETVKLTVTQRSTAPTETIAATPFPALPTATQMPAPTLILNPTIVIPADRLALTTRNAANMKRIARWGQGELQDIAWSPDGKSLAVATGVGVYLYNTATFQVEQFIDVDDVATKIAFRPDGKVMAIAQDTSVSIWSLDSGRKIAEMKGEIAGGIWELAYGSGGQVAALGQQVLGAGEPLPQVKLWQDTTGRLLFEESDFYPYHSNKVLDFSPDGKLFLYVSGSGLEVRDIASGKRVTNLSDWENEAYDAVFSPDGAKVYFSRAETEKEWNAIWDLSTGKVTSLPQNIQSGGLTRNGNAVVHFGLFTGLLAPTVQGSFKTDGIVLIATVSPDGLVLAYEDEEKESTILIREVATGNIIQTLTFPGFTSPAAGMAMLDGKAEMLAAVGFPGEIQVWDLISGNVARRLAVPGEEVNGLAFSPDRRSLASVDTSRTVRIWDLPSGKDLAQYQTGPDIDPGSELDGPLVYTPDGSRLVMTTVAQGNLVGLDIQAGTFSRLGENPSTYSYAYSLTFLPAEVRAVNDVLVWSVDFEQKMMILINLATGPETFYPLPPEIEFTGVETIALSADGKYLAAGVDSGSIFLWEVNHPRLPVVLKGHEERHGDGWVGAIRHMEFSPAADLLVSVGWDDTTRLWNVAATTPLRTLEVCCYASFTPDGRFLVTAGSGVIRVWGIKP